MAAKPFFHFVLPSALLGLVLGYAGAIVLGVGGSGSTAGEKKTPRAAFLASDDDEIDYDKLARVCVEAARRTAGPRPSAANGLASTSTPEEVTRAKDELDRVMTISLDKGVWSRGAAFRADNFLDKISPADAADFERLVRTALERGDLQLQDGAWLPGEGN